MIIQRKFVLGVAVALAAVLLVMGYCMFPVPFTDARSYVGTAISFSRGHGLTTTIYPGLEPSSDGHPLRVLYPPLFFWTLGMLTPSSSIRGAFVIQAVWCCLCLAMSAHLLWKTASRGGRLSWPMAVIVCLALISQCSRWLPAEGRPEILASVWLLLGMIAVEYVRLPWQWLPLGALLGLMGATHPVNALTSATLIAAYLTARFPPLPALGRLVGVGVVALAVLAGVLAASPYGFWAVLSGTTSGGRNAIVPAWGGLNYFLLAGRTPFSGLFVVMAVAVGVRFWIQRRSRIASPILFYPSAAMFCICAWYFSIRAPARNYNLLMFVPLLHWSVIGWLAELDGASPQVATARRWLMAIAGAAFAATGVGFLRYSLLLLVFCARGTDLSSARGAMDRLIARSPKPVAVSPDVWPLLSNYDDVFVIDSRSRMELADAVRIALEHDVPQVIVSGTDGPSRATLEAHGYSAAESFGNTRVSANGPVPAWAYGYGFVEYRAAPGIPLH